MHSLSYLKTMLVYFESFNRHLYRYNGLVILEKIFIHITNDKEIDRLFCECCKQGLHNQIRILLKKRDVSQNTVHGNPIEIACKFGHFNESFCVSRIGFF